MKIDEVQVGETYAVSRSGYDNPLRVGAGGTSGADPAVVRVLAIEKVTAKANSWGGTKTRNVRRLIVEFAQPYVEKAFYTDKVLAEYAAGDRYPQPLDAKFLLQPWSEYQQARAEEVEWYRPGKERVERLTEMLGPYFTDNTQIRPRHSNNETGEIVVRFTYAQVDEMLDLLKTQENLANAMGRARDDDGGSVE